MTHKRDWLPQNHEALYDKATQTWGYLSVPERRNRLGFGADTPPGHWLDEYFYPKWREFDTAFQDWRDPSERTKSKHVQLKDMEKVFKAAYRNLYTGFLKGSPLVTDEDLVSMGLPKRSSGRTHAPVPTTHPGAYVDTPVSGRVIIHFYNREGRHKKAKPAGVHGARIHWAVFDAPATVPLEELVHSSFSTRTPCTLEFSGDQRGKRLYFALCWENTRGAKGPFGEVINTIIP
jgi:hypothetical protein